MNRRRRQSGVFIALIAVASACHAPRSDEAPSAAASSSKPALSEPLPYSRDGLSAFQRALSGRCSDACSVLMLEFSPARAVAQVESKERLGQLVEYRWSTGVLSGPIPIELHGKGNLAKNLFPLSAVDLTAIPALVDAAIAKVDREHGRLQRVLIRRNLPEDEAISMRVFVDSPVRSGQLDADARGRPPG
jgi:hypothetical protein